MKGLLAPGKLGDFRIATTGGRSVARADMLGKSTLYFGWASWDPSRDLLARVEAFYREHKAHIDVASIAFDAEGPALPMRYYTSARCTHTPLIDATFLLARAWGITRIPFWVLVDEGGCIQDSGEGFDATKVAAALDKEPEHHKEHAGKKVHRFEKFEFQVQQVAIFMSRARTDDAVAALESAGRLKPDSGLIRPQILAISNPDRFYKGRIDTAWVTSQLRKKPASKKK